MKKNYYYLVAGLADLLPSTGVKGYDYLTLRAEILEELSVQDQHAVAWLCYFYDNHNVVALLQGKVADFDNRGFLSLEELQEAINSGENIPPYLVDFLRSYKELSSERALLDVLYESYFAALQTQIPWLVQWGNFHATLLNVLGALGARHMHLPQEQSVILAGLEPEHIQKSSSADFGLGLLTPWIEQLTHAKQDNRKLEELIDSFMWHRADELTEGCYFSLEVLLCFMVKLNSVERWMRLDEETGKARLEALMADLKAAPTTK